MLQQALEFQRRGQFAEALDLYDRHLQSEPANADAWHMGGVSLYQLGRYGEAVGYYLRASELVGEPAPDSLRINFGLCVAALRQRAEPPSPPPGSSAPRDQFLRRGALPDSAPCQSLTVVLHAGAAHLGNATNRPFDFGGGAVGEVIVVGEAADEISLPFGGRPSPRSMHRIRTGTAPVAEALNAGVEKATGDIVFLLGDGGSFAPGRMPLMAQAIEASGAAWGFSGVDFLSGDGQAASPGISEDVDLLLRDQERRYEIESWFEGLATGNLPVALGNLVFRRTAWAAIGGLDPAQAYPGLDMARRALLHSEPAYFDEPLYLAQQPRLADERLHGKARHQHGIAWLESCAMRLPESDPRLALVERALRGLRDRVDVDALRRAQGHRFSLARIRALCPGP